MSEFEDWLQQKEARRSRKRDAKNGIRDNTRLKRKPIRSRPKTGFSVEVREQAAERADGRCENPLCRTYLPDIGGEHHCIPRSQYKGDDRNELWNCAHICSDCHYRVTVLKSDEDKRLRRYFERVAISRRMQNNGQEGESISSLDSKLRNQTLELERKNFQFTN